MTGAEQIVTFNGNLVDPLNIGAWEVDILQIARGLACQGRFRGARVGFYSVAQHSVEVSYAVPAADALWGLLHDAPEAYLADMPAPVKARLPDVLAAERRIMRAICVAYGMDPVEPKSVRQADRNCTAAEGCVLFPGSDPAIWLALAQTNPSEWRVPRVLLEWSAAEKVFLARFCELRQRPENALALAGPD